MEPSPSRATAGRTPSGSSTLLRRTSTRRMLRIDRALVPAMLMLVPGVASCRSAPSCHRQPDGSVVACVDGAAVHRRQVEELVTEPWWTPGSASLPEPRHAALDRATRMFLL